MGLDMYLFKKRHLGFDNNEVVVSNEKVDDNVKTIIKETFKNVKSIEQNVGYWRKANHIHGWFVKNVQDGNDDCKDYYVSIDKLKELKGLCEMILKSDDVQNVAPDLLPTCDGFFFGSTDYDEYYIEDLKQTIDIIDNVLEDFDEYRDELIYSSSW